ncbi:recombinase family protein [Zwartia vadi]|uniref:recombinase family protein n=1 Tax=Zwartia vadi TaxID=3058168 RepID=UPI0025B54A97|nr:recombinase family protein [Zwartia vadi]MDN3987395.1 recombinase family protein [Zwartia vadi]
MKETLHIYTRVSSTAQQEDGTSLESQKQLGIRRAEELGFEPRLWNEGGQSSSFDDLKNRPVLVSLLTLIESGSVKNLFVYNTDRLSRNQQTWAVIRYKLLSHGVTLHSASGQMKLKNPVDDLMLGILSEISQYDNRIRSERSRLGKFHKIQQGNWKGGPPPFGYRLTNRQLEIDPFESEWVKSMFGWYCQGISVKEIQTRLSRQGVMTRRGNTQWSLGSIQLILRNPVYSGYYDYCDKMVGETVRIPAPQIIDAHLFQIAQDKRRLVRERKLQPEATKHFYLLRGILSCGHCGSMMGGRINKAGNQSVYYCVKKERSWKTRGEDHPKWKRGIECSMVRSVNIEKTNQCVWNLIKTTLREIRDQSPIKTVVESTEDQIHHDRVGLLGDEISWMTEEQLELLNDVDRKNIINKMISSTTVHFDEKTKKHTLHVTFSEATQRVINTIRERKSSSANNGNHLNETSESLSEARIKDQGNIMGESPVSLQTSPDDIVRLFGDGGVIEPSVFLRTFQRLHLQALKN